MNIFKSISLGNFENRSGISETFAVHFLFTLRAGVVLKWIQNDPKIIQKRSQMVPAPPIPIPGVSKSLLPGGNKTIEKVCLMLFCDIDVKSFKTTARG